jgi:DNA-binding response OmpR family regulator
MIKNLIVIVDDDDGIRELVGDLLEFENFKVIKCANTDDGYKKILKYKPDLIFLDVKMPQIGGIELCRILRQEQATKNIPIIMLTVESTEHDKVTGLGVGADDYITKPFSNQELIARVRAILRRTGRKEEKQVLKLNGLIMDLEARRVTVSGKEIMLRPKEFDLLQMFLSKQDMVVSKELILEKIFDYNSDVNTRTVDTHIKNLRQALGGWSGKIVTVFGKGFKLVKNDKKK